MKHFTKTLALLLSCLLVLSLFAGCNSVEADPIETDASDVAEISPDAETDPAQEDSHEEEEEHDHHDHNHINYKGLTSKSISLEDVAAVEGKNPDFNFETGGVTYYAYNNVTLENLNFQQVQFSFHEDYVRISCTDTYEDAAALADTLGFWGEEMDLLYGEGIPLDETSTVLHWADHTGNYVTLSQLNDTTVQLCFYLVA